MFVCHKPGEVFATTQVVQEPVNVEFGVKTAGLARDAVLGYKPVRQ